MEGWYWYYDEKVDALMIDLSQGIVFRSRLSKKMVISDALIKTQFSLQDAAFYYQFLESSELLSLSEPHRIELVLNSLAAKNYLKPVMPKSWYFAQQRHCLLPKVGEIVTTHTLDTGEPINLLAIDSGANASLCIIAQHDVHLADKIFCLGDAIKIMHDRFAPSTISTSSKNDSLKYDGISVQHVLNEVG